ncbi:MAG: sulfatase [Acidobacteriota bacterium]
MNILTRRQFVQSAGAFAAAPPKERPNVLFIAIDDLNDWIGCLGGHPDVRTPNLDRLAARGVLFTNAHCAAPLCNPSRAALLTGTRPSTSGVYDNGQPFRKADPVKNAVTLPQHFMAHGYRVVGGGKIYHGAFPDAASWHEYFPSQTQNKPPDPAPAKLPANGIPNTAQFDWGPVDVPDSAMGDWKVVDWAIRELGQRHDKPFFLGCGIFRPHLPWYVPRKYFDLYPPATVTLPNVKDDDLDDVPPIGRKFARPDGDHKKVIEHNQWRQAVQAYLASISFTDACIGRLLDAFDASPHAKNTAIVLWSDHGWHLGEKLHWRKFALWEEATHNVFMVVAPGVTAPGGRCDRSVSLMDIYPTLIDLCGLAPRKGLEGSNLLPLLRNPRASWDRPALTTYQRGNHSVRSERWRYIRYRDGTEELYDRQSDELEWHNLAGKPEYHTVKRELARWLPPSDAPDSPRERGGEGVGALGGESG